MASSANINRPQKIVPLTPVLDGETNPELAKWIRAMSTSFEELSEQVRAIEMTESTDFMLEVAKGNHRGHSVVNKFGNNGTVGTSSTETIWDGSNTYTLPTSASITHIRSAADSGITQGVTIEVQGLDADWVLTVQSKATDGSDSATEVALDTPLRRVFRVKVLDDTAMDEDLWVGATGMAAGTASAIVQEGNNQTLMALWTCPANKTAYVDNYWASLNSNGGGDPDVVVKMWQKDNTNGYAPQLKHLRGLDSDASSHFTHVFSPQMKLTEKTDIYLSAQNLSGSATADVSAGFDLIVIDD